MGKQVQKGPGNEKENQGQMDRSSVTTGDRGTGIDGFVDMRKNKAVALFQGMEGSGRGG